MICLLITEHVISLEYLTYFIVLHCVLAAFCQLLLNECIVLHCIVEKLRILWPTMRNATHYFYPGSMRIGNLMKVALKNAYSIACFSNDSDYHRSFVC